jgi:MoxR-like ATPase
VLDEDHYDLKEVKDRILEYLAVRKLIGEREAEKDAAGETVADAAKPATADPTDAATTGNGRRGGRRARKRSGPAASGPDADADGAAATARRPDSTGDKPHATGGESDRTGDEPDATRGGSDRIGDEPDATRRESEPTGGRVERRGTPNARTQRRDGGNGGLTPGSRSSRSPRPILPLEDVIGIFSVVPDEDITDLELSRQIDEYTEDFVAELEEASEKAKEEEGEASRGDEAGPEPPGEADPEPRSEDDSERKPRPDPDPAPESDEGADEKPDARAGTILCFVGPPGVGKTSLGKSIARALGRKFTRMSLGGMRDEAEIRGHRRTYIGALPGRIIQGIKRAGTRNPVFMLDEVDKIGADWRGDPASALLEVLDPAQNHAYRDHYLDVDFDLSDVIFIATANNLETIPQALRDRMEILQLEGYTDHDKLRIAEQYLVPRQRRSNGLREDEVRFTEEAIRKIIHDYTREAGVRELERQIGTVCRKAAVGIAEGSISELAVTPEIVRAHLKAERYHSESSEEFRIPGVATGLAVTAGGGDILYIEATRMKGKGGLTLTGHLGDVMKESAQIASSYVRSKAAQYGIDPEIFEKTDVHVHVPAGAIPKDGPSAGVAMVAATVSLLTGRKVRHDVGMTGEVTLRGRVLPVGGVKMKVLAAHRAGLTTVVLPKKNEPDLEELPEVVRREMTFVPVEVIDEGLKTILEPEIEESSGRPPGDPTGRRAIAEAQRT